MATFTEHPFLPVEYVARNPLRCSDASVQRTINISFVDATTAYGSCPPQYMPNVELFSDLPSYKAT